MEGHAGIHVFDDGICVICAENPTSDEWVEGLEDRGVHGAGGSLGCGGFLLYGRFTLLATTGGGTIREEVPLALG